MHLAAGRSDGACRRSVVIHVTTDRRHPQGHCTSSMQASSAHANASHRVHTDDRQRHVQAASGRNTSRGARKEALGRLPMRNGSRPGKAQPCESANSCIYNIRHIAPGDERPLCAETFCGILYRANCISLYVLQINADFRRAKTINIFGSSREAHGYWKTTGRFRNQGIAWRG